MHLRTLNILNQGTNPLSDFIPELISTTHSLLKTDKRSIEGILYLITHLGDQYHEHYVYKDCYCFSQEELYDVFGQYNYRTHIHNNTNHIFNKLFSRWHIGNHIDGIGGSAYSTSDYFDKAYLEWIVANEDEKCTLTNTNITVNTQDADVSSHIVINIDAIENRIKNNCSELREYLNAYNHIDSDDLDDYQVIDSIKMIDSNRNHRNHLIHEVSTLRYILATSKNGILELQYKTSDAGRYYGFGTYHLQSMKKELRNFILNDYKSFDIESAAPVILAQIYTNITNKRIPESIQNYIDNKNDFRRTLSLELEKDTATAKKIYTMLFFGSSVKVNDNFLKNAINAEIGIEGKKILLENDYFKLLAQDVDMIFQEIGNHYRKNFTTETYQYEIKNGKNHKITTWTVTNSKNRTLIYKGVNWKNSKVVAHVYQGVESMILDACIDYYKSKHDNASYLLIHDGFYSQHNLNTNDLEKYIFETTGFKVDFTPRKQTLPIETICKELFPNVYNKVINYQKQKEFLAS